MRLSALFVLSLFLAEPIQAQSLADDLIQAGRSPVKQQNSVAQAKRNTKKSLSTKSVKTVNALEQGFMALNELQRRNVQEFLKLIGFYKSGIDGKFGAGTRTALMSMADLLNLVDINTETNSKALFEGILNFSNYSNWSETNATETFSTRENLVATMQIDSENLIKFIETQKLDLPMDAVFYIKDLNLFIDEKVDVIVGVSALNNLYSIPIVQKKFKGFLFEQKQKTLMERQASNSANKDFLRLAKEKLTLWIQRNILDTRGPTVLGLIQDMDKITSLNSDQPLDEIVNRTLELGQELGLDFERPRTQAYLNSIAALQPGKIDLAAKGGPLSIELVNEKKELIDFLLLDLEAFLIQGGTGFSFTLAKDVADARAILNRVWGTTEATYAEQFVQKLMSNEKFKQFHEQAVLKRSEENSKRVAELKSELDPKLEALAQWVALNLLNSRAAEVAQFLSDHQSVDTAEDAKILNEVLVQVDALVSELGVNIHRDDNNLEFKPNAHSFDPDKFYVLANVSGRAENSYVDLDGTFSATKKTFVACHEGTKIDTFTQVELSNSIFANSKSAENIIWKEFCNPTADLRVTTGFNLNENPVSVVGNTKENIILTEVSKSELSRAFEKSQIQKEILLDDIKVSTRKGFGVLTFNLEDKFFCGLASEDLERVHQDMMTSAETVLFAHTGHDRLLKHMVSNAKELFISAQRGGCSALYADSDSLREIVNGLELLQQDFDVLPFWISVEAVDSAKEEYDLIEAQEQNALAKNLRTKDDENRIAEARARELAALAENKQKQLQRENNTRYTSLIVQLKDYLDQFALDSLSADQINDILPFAQSLASVNRGDLLEEDLNVLNIFYESLVHLRKDAWKLVDTEVAKRDYGFVEFEKRNLQAVEFQYSTNMQNRVIGQYDTFCVAFAGVFDEDFRVWRKLATSPCEMENGLIRWKNLNNFRSAWLVTSKDLEDSE